MNKSGNISVYGTYVLPSFIEMRKGWNLVGYPLAVPTPLNSTLTGISPYLSLVLGYNASDTLDPWKRFDPSQDPSFNDLTTLTPLHGYWINLTANATWELDE